MKDSFLKSDVTGVSGDIFQSEERERGMVAMLPNWTREIDAEKLNISQLLIWINDVINRQTDVFDLFSSYFINREGQYMGYTSPKTPPFLEQVFADRIR